MATWLLFNQVGGARGIAIVGMMVCCYLHSVIEIAGRVAVVVTLGAIEIEPLVFNVDVSMGVGVH